ncbi:hypothetical protein [Paracoccus aminophilus]|uniref:Uncharacterized protein n=1 Tax=Paracoccus aminophilus JCM 7686 TaxID=1367847 RepID=S5XW50_PARAH|nr:hypothetical protein [Paracoccus aminophilus]AGT09517.1 hypothetical protein JCM7686_2449 [Paracoccus aminophilus JCM 7686]
MRDPIREFSEFSRSDDALIGKLVRAFGLLESAVSELILTICKVAPSFLDAKGISSSDALLGKLLKSGIGGMCGFIKDYVESAYSNHPRLRMLSTDLVEFVSSTKTLRNIICHGSWQILGHDHLTCRFWSDAARDHASNCDRADAQPWEYTYARSDLHTYSTEIVTISRRILELNGILLDGMSSLEKNKV